MDSSVDKKNIISSSPKQIDRMIELKNTNSKSENFKDKIVINIDSNNLNNSFNNKKNLNNSTNNEIFESDNNSIDDHNSNNSLDSIKNNNLDNNIGIVDNIHSNTFSNNEPNTSGFFNTILDKFTDIFNKTEKNVEDVITNIDNSEHHIYHEHDIGEKSESNRKNSMLDHSDTNRLSRYLDFFSNDCDNDLCKTNYLDEKGFLKTYKEYCTHNNGKKLSEAEYIDRIASEINYNNGKVCQTTFTRSSDVYNYLIILKKKDFVKNIFRCSRKDGVRKLEHKMSGNLHIGLNTIDMCECHFKEYVVKNLIQTNQLYIQLPKEKSYVLANVWSLEYTKSQINEFIEILALLGANEISYKITNNEYAKVKKKGNINTGLEHFGLSSKAENESINADKNIFEGDIKFKDNKNKFTNIGHFYEHVKKHNDSFSYLNKRADWRDIIKNRFNSNTIYYQFSFGNDHIEDNDFDVSLQFKKIGISYDSEKLNHNNFTTLFNITFESL